MNHDKAQTEARMATLRQLNKQQQRKLQDQSMSANFMVEEQKTSELETRAAEAEAKLKFAMDQFEEQNRKFQQCGQELAEAYETIERHEAQVEQLTRDLDEFKKASASVHLATE